MVPQELGAARQWVLLPAVPATIALHAILAWSWRESTVAAVGLSLVLFWILMAVSAPYLPVLDPNKPIRPFLTPGSTQGGITFLLGTDMRGLDMLSHTIWGCG